VREVRERFAWISFLGASHGDEELGAVVHDLIEASDETRIRARIAHPRALEQKKRFFTDEISTQYVSPPRLSPGAGEDAVAAYWNARWIGRRANIPGRVISDGHCTTVDGGAHSVVGPVTSRVALAAAFDLTGSNVVVADRPFYRNFKNAVSHEVEVSAAGPSSMPAAARVFQRNLLRLAHLGAEELEAGFHGIENELAFFEYHSIPTRGLDGVRPAVLLLEKEVRCNRAFSPIDLDDGLRKLLGLPKGRFVSLTPPHDNMSRQLPVSKYGTFEGRPRREFWSAILRRIAPPVGDGPWVKFEGGT
jgi:hypothetical protein